MADFGISHVLLSPPAVGRPRVSGANLAATSPIGRRLILSIG